MSTTTELFAEFERVLSAQNADPEGFYTCSELAELFGVGSEAVQRRLRAIKNAGRLEVTKVQRETLTGSTTRVPAYRILPAAE